MAAPRSVLYSVAASLAAAHLMSQVPGFRRRFEEALGRPLDRGEDPVDLDGERLNRGSQVDPPSDPLEERRPSSWRPRRES